MTGTGGHGGRRPDRDGPGAASTGGAGRDGRPQGRGRPWAAWAPAAMVGGAALGVALVLLFGLGRDGLWDPIELDRADEAQYRVGLGEEAEEPPAPGRAAGEATAAPEIPKDPRPFPAVVWVGTGFRLFGVQSWAGRLPLALAGWLAALAAGLLAWRFAGRRPGTAALAILAFGTTPAAILNARTLLGDAPGILAQTLLGLALAEVVLEGAGRDAGGLRRDPVGGRAFRMAGLRLVTVGLAAALSAGTSGVLLGVLPPLTAAGLVVFLRWSTRRPAVPPDLPTGALRMAAVVVAGVVLAEVAEAVAVDAASGSGWVGGTPRALDPPTFEAQLAGLFHALVPWSALLVPALGALLAGAPVASTGAPADLPEPPSLRPFLGLWIVASFVATTVFTARYGPATFLALAPIAVAIALLLSDVGGSRRGWPLGAVVVGMMVFLAWRDLRLYPEAPLAGLPWADPEVPEGFDPRRGFGLALLAAGLLFVVPLAVGAPAGRTPEPSGEGATTGGTAGLRGELAAPYRLLRAQWRRDLGTRLWLIFAALALAGLLVFGLVAALAPEAAQLTSLGRRLGRGVLLGLALLPLSIAVIQLAIRPLRRLGALRLAPIALAGLGLGAWFAHGWLPDLSSRLSPRSLYRTLETLAAPGEPFAVAELGRKGAGYYLERDLTTVEGPAALGRFLETGEERGERRWAAVEPEAFPRLDRDFRRRTGSHLFVAEWVEGNAVLVANEPVPGVEDRNPLVRFVRTEVPPVEHPVDARLGDYVELVGYDLELPEDRPYVGAGERFTIRWVWKVLRRIPGSYEVFLHIDGAGQRIHGDHEPVDGRYPVRLWEPGDVVIDEQTIDVPASHRPGQMTLWVGLYAGERRLEVVKGPEDGADRIRAGQLVVR